MRMSISEENYVWNRHLFVVLPTTTKYFRLKLELRVFFILLFSFSPRCNSNINTKDEFIGDHTHKIGSKKQKTKNKIPQ